MTSPRLPPSQADAACGGMFKLVEGYSAETSGGLMLCLPEENAEVRGAAWCAHSSLALLVLKNGRVVRCVVCAVVCTCLSGCWGYLPPLHLSNACHIRPLPAPPAPRPVRPPHLAALPHLRASGLREKLGVRVWCVVCSVRYVCGLAGAPRVGRAVPVRAKDPAYIVCLHVLTTACVMTRLLMCSHYYTTWECLVH